MIFRLPMNCLLSAMLYALCSMPARADVVHLKSGGKIEGRVSEEGGSIVVDTGRGTITLKKEDVARIEQKDFTPPAAPVLKKTPPRLRDSYAHPFYAFKIFLPAGWQKGPTKEEQKVSFYGPKDGVYTPRMDLTVRATKTDVGAFVNALKATFVKEYQDVVFPQEEALTLHGSDAYQFLISFSDGSAKMRALWTVAGRDNRITCISFACAEAAFDNYYSAVDASMRSLRLFPLSSAPLEQRKEFAKVYEQGYSLAKEGKSAEAVQAFVRAAELLPEFADIHSIVGQLHVKTGNLADAERAFRKAREIDAEDYEFAFNLGVVLLRLERYEDAIASLSDAVKADPAMEPALTNLGVAWLAKGDAGKAAEVLEKAVLADPESPSAHYNRGVAFERLGKKKEAEAEFRETLKVEPKHQGAKDGLTRVRK